MLKNLGGIKMGKVISLKREVATNLKSKGIPALDEMGLKKVNFDVKDVHSSVRNTVFKKAGKVLLSDLNLQEITSEDLKGLVQGGPIELKVSEISEISHSLEVRTTNAAIKESATKYFELEVCDSRVGITHKIITSNSNKYRSEGVLTLRSQGGNYFNILSLELIIGIAFIFNEIAKYEEGHKNIMMLLRYSYLKEKGQSLKVSSDNELKTLLDRMKQAEIIDDSFNIEIDSSLTCKNGYAISLYDMFDVTGSGHYSFNSGYYYNLNYFAVIYDHIIGLNYEEKEKVKRNRSLETDYAKSFETKKNIPEYIQEAMHKSVFSNYFNFVEFDELTKLDEMEKIEKEWIELTKILNFQAAKNHSLRFRRLGHHKAGGLYYPAMKAVCIDLESPSSLVHELMHMIDYTTKEVNLSESYEFYRIKEMYKEIVTKNIGCLEDDNALKSKWNGSTKHNKSYYLSSEEIFARTGEVYVRQVLNIDNSLVNGVGPLYPSEDRFLRLVEDYFSKLDLNNPVNKEVSSSNGQVAHKSVVEKPSKTEEEVKKDMEIDNKMKRVLIKMSESIMIDSNITVDEVQFFELKSYIDKNGEKKQGIKHSQVTGDYSKVYIGEIKEREYNLKAMLIGEEFSIIN